MHPHSHCLLPPKNYSLQLGLGLGLRASRRRPCITCLDLLHDGVSQALRLGRARPPPLDLPVRAHEELLEVPLDALEAHDARLLRLEPVPDGRGGIAVDLDFLQNGEADPVIDLAEALDVVIGAWVLRRELVARKAEDGEPVWVLGVQVFVELLEAFELWREAAFGGGVDNENGLAAEGAKVERLSLLCKWNQYKIVGERGKLLTAFGLEIEEAGCRCHSRRRAIGSNSKVKLWC